MICYIYRSSVKTEMYLYCISKDDFTNVPEQLLRLFSKPEFSMVLNLEKRDNLARADIDLVKAQLLKDGYYLQMPPKVLNDQNDLTEKSLSKI
jgi:uncharacterized protein YcgL (UPF0745 family)